ncbi:MAG: nickel pincer cofactor biosynthesis protein LarC [Halodesulfurarchaeum sp.]
MLLGTLVSIGADPGVLERVEAVLPVEYEIHQVDRTGIQATHVRVTSIGSGGEGTASDGSESGEKHDDGHRHHEGHHHDDDQTHSWNGHGHRQDDHSHSQTGHSHHHDHASPDGDNHKHEPNNEEQESSVPDQEAGERWDTVKGHGPHRTLPEVLDIVERMALPDSVATEAKATFRILGEAEASVHGTEVDSVHFHEVGADDAIADIVGTALLLYDLDVERIVTTPVATGSGTVSSSHGTYPVPPPAVLEIAERADWSIRSGPVSGELLTPTGAALLAHFATGVSSIPPIRVESSGYGAGSREYEGRPNVLRGILGSIEEANETASAARESPDLETEPVTVLETTVDDVTPEVLGGLHERLSGVGALDVAVLPATLKKSRPGHVVQVITKPDDAKGVARRLSEETGTLGVRVNPVSHRWIAERRVESVTVQIEETAFEIGVKVATDRSGERYDVSAEFDDALGVAEDTGLPVREIMRRAESAALEDR